MPYKSSQYIRKLEPKRGGYYFLWLEAAIVEQFSKGKKTRLICKLDDTISYSCGLNHSGDGNFFIIVATRLMKKLKKVEGDLIHFVITEDPNPLGIEVPEVLLVVLEENPDLKKKYEEFTDGKKRSLIHSFNRIKNIDRQIAIIFDFMENGPKNSRRKK